MVEFLECCSGERSQGGVKAASPPHDCTPAQFRPVPSGLSSRLLTVPRTPTPNPPTLQAALFIKKRKSFHSKQEKSIQKKTSQPYHAKKLHLERRQNTSLHNLATSAAIWREREKTASFYSTAGRGRPSGRVSVHLRKMPSDLWGHLSRRALQICWLS